MRLASGVPSWLRAHTAAERPDLWQRARDDERFYSLWPEYNQHGNHAASYFSALVPSHAHLQVLLVDERRDELVGRGRTIPFRWDGSLDDLPTGIDAVGRRALAGPGPTTALSALAAEVLPAYQRQGLSRVLLTGMATLAREAGLSPLVAPVRPSAKDRYPLAPIESYVRWSRPDGSAFDPWIRVHLDLGGQVLRCEPRSMQISAPVPEWEQWTGMAFPEAGRYIFPGGLTTLEVEDGVATYFEPNVWIRHEV